MGAPPYREDIRNEVRAYIGWGYSNEEAAKLAGITADYIQKSKRKFPGYADEIEREKQRVYEDEHVVRAVAAQIVVTATSTRRWIRLAQALGLWVQVTHGQDDTRIEIWKSPERCTTAIDKSRSVCLVDETIK